MRCVMCNRSFLQDTDWLFPFCNEHTVAQYEAWLSCSKETIMLSWTDVVILCEDIARQIQISKREYAGIYGIPRGGIPVADILSDLLRLPEVFLQREFRTVHSLGFYWKRPVLIVDDVEDVSFTLQNFLFWDCAVLLNKPWSKRYARYVGRTTTDWIIFPWEAGRD